MIRDGLARGLRRIKVRLVLQITVLVQNKPDSGVEAELGEGCIRAEEHELYEPSLVLKEKSASS